MSVVPQISLLGHLGTEVTPGLPIVSEFFTQYNFPGGSVVKNLPANAGDADLIPGSRRSPGEGDGKPTPVFLPGKFHGRRNLTGYSPCVHKESDTPEHTHGITVGAAIN